MERLSWGHIRSCLPGKEFNSGLRMANGFYISLIKLLSSAEWEHKLHTHTHVHMHGTYVHAHTTHTHKHNVYTLTSWIDLAP